MGRNTVSNLFVSKYTEASKIAKEAVYGFPLFR